MIEIRQVVRSFGPTKILDGVDLTVNRGEVAVLVGPSGGGKSTLLRCVNGLETFDSGEIVVGNLTLGAKKGREHLSAIRKNVGMVFQAFHLFPHMTALENVLSGPVYSLGESADVARPRAKALLERVGLGSKLESKPAELSGGQQQRVAIARALAVNPSAILFDEPTSALDPMMALEVQSVISELAHDGQTMLVVTHDFPFARKVATVVHRMVAGKITESGPADRMLP